MQNSKKRLLSLFLVFVMLLGFIPFNARIDSETYAAKGNVYDSNNVLLEGKDEKGKVYIQAGRKASEVRGPNDFTLASTRGVHGRAYDMTGADFNAADNNNPVPNGTVIYFQWMDTDGTTSPIYTAKTFTLGNGPRDGGWYSFNGNKQDGENSALDYVDVNGKVHKLAYQTTRQKYRIWLAPGQKSPNGNKWTTARQAPGGQVGFFGGAETSAGTFMLAGANFQKTAVFVYEVPEDISYMVAPKGNSKFTGANGQLYPRYKIDDRGINQEFGIKNVVSGKVWWELSDNLVTFPTSTADVQVPQNTVQDGLRGIRVITSALTKQGAAAMANINRMPINTRIRETKKLLEQNPDYIMQTVESPVVYSGRGNVADYVARFDDKIETNYLYQFVIDGKGEILNAINMSPVPVFSGTNEFTLNTGTEEVIKGGRYNVNVALVNNPFKSWIDITNYDLTEEGAAAPGDVARINLESTFLPGQITKIVWVDENERVVQENTYSSLEEAKKDTFTVPNDLSKKTVYSARLVINGLIIDADSFVADPLPKVRLHRNLDENDKQVDTVSLKTKTDKTVKLPVLRNSKEYKQKNKYFVGWSRNPKATNPDKNVLINERELNENSTKDLYVRDGIVYKLPKVGKSVDLYAVWKEPFKVKATKEWVNTIADKYDTSNLKFGLLYRASVGTFGKEVVSEIATYEPLRGQMKPYVKDQEIVWENLPSYSEDGKRISYLLVELPTAEMQAKYEAGDTNWSTYNINVVEKEAEGYRYSTKEQTLSLTNNENNTLDAITGATLRQHIVKGNPVNPYSPENRDKVGYFDTEGYVISVKNTKQELTPPVITQKNVNDKEIEILVNSESDITGIKGELKLKDANSGNPVKFKAIVDKGTGTWQITYPELGQNLPGIEIDTNKSTKDKLVLKYPSGLKDGDKVVAKTFKTVGAEDVESSADSMTVVDNNSRLPKEIKQSYSDDNTKAIITAKPYQENVNGQDISVVPSTTKYTLVDNQGNPVPGVEPVQAQNNEIKFIVPKDRLTDGAEYSIKVEEPQKKATFTKDAIGEASRGGNPSNKSVVIDITGPKTPENKLPDINGFVGNKFTDVNVDIVEENGPINIVRREGPNGLQLNIEGNRGTISGTPKTQYDGKYNVEVEDVFGNKSKLEGNAKILAKVIDDISNLPEELKNKYYPITFKSDDKSTLIINGAKVNTKTQYVLKDFNGDGGETVDPITLAQAKEAGLIVPNYELTDNNSRFAAIPWSPNFEADGFRFDGTVENSTFTLQTETNETKPEKEIYQPEYK